MSLFLMDLSCMGLIKGLLSVSRLQHQMMSEDISLRPRNQASFVCFLGCLDRIKDNRSSCEKLNVLPWDSLTSPTGRDNRYIHLRHSACYAYINSHKRIRCSPLRSRGPSTPGVSPALALQGVLAPRRLGIRLSTKLNKIYVIRCYLLSPVRQG